MCSNTNVDGIEHNWEDLSDCWIIILDSLIATGSQPKICNLKWSSSWFAIANQERQFLIQSKGQNYIWRWKCLRQGHIPSDRYVYFAHSSRGELYLSGTTMTCSTQALFLSLFLAIFLGSTDYILFKKLMNGDKLVLKQDALENCLSWGG